MAEVLPWDMPTAEMEPPGEPWLWPEPEEIPASLRPVPSFNERMLPEPFRKWLVDIADRMQCPLDFTAAASVLMTAGVIGRRISIFPKQLDDWLVIPNLWGGIVGRPGTLKSHAAAEVFEPLKDLQEAAREENKLETHRQKADVEILKARRDAIKGALQKAVKAENEQEIDRLKECLIEIDTEEEADRPLRKRYIVNDATVEKLGIILEQNPKGILLYRDELAGFFATLDKQGHEPDRTFYLESWNGTGGYDYDRIGRDDVFIKAACVSLFGTIQPGKLERYLTGALRNYTEDGLFQRLQILVYPDKGAAGAYIDREPDSSAKERAYKLIARLDKANPEDFGAVPVDGKATHALRFSAAAQECFIDWTNTLEKALSKDDETEVIISHLSKYRSLMPSLALLFHLCDIADGKATPGPVSLEATQRAAAWTAYLEQHARRIYGMAANAELEAARLLIKKIKAGKLDTEFRAADIVRKGWTQLNSTEQVHAALNVLADYGWVRRVEIPSSERGGRPGALYQVNPKQEATG